MMPDFEKLEELHNLCKWCGLSWSMTYGEGEDNFYFTISSPVKEENYMTKDMGFEFAFNDVMEFVEKIAAEYP